jgi:hypothetical protein
MGQHAECDSCDFEFLGGHSHHAGCSNVVCIACLARFALPTDSHWGPNVGEMIFLCKIVGKFQSPHQVSPKKAPWFEQTEEFLIAESAGEWGV